MIANTDRAEWWSILDIESKKDFFLFNSFSIAGLKNFIVKNDEKIVQKVLKGVEDIKQDKTGLNLVNLKFSVNGYYELSDNKKLALSETAVDLFHFIENFARYEKQQNLNVRVLEDPIQDLRTDTWGPFQRYFYGNLFFLDQSSELQEYKKLTKGAIHDFINAIFSVDNNKKKTNNRTIH